MADETLVDEQIHAGSRLIETLVDDGLDVSAACWLYLWNFEAEEGEWLFCLVMPDVDQIGLALTYERVLPVLEKLNSASLTMFQLRAKGLNSDVCKKLQEFHRQFAQGLMPLNSKLDGNYYRKIYVYSDNFRYSKDYLKWRGMAIDVSKVIDRPDVERVSIYPQAPQFVRGPNGPFRRVPNPAVVLVSEGKVISFTPPENPLLSISREDYEAKALEAVEAVLSPTQ